MTFESIPGVGNLQNRQRRDRAIVWHDLFSGEPHFEFHENRNEK